MIVDSSTANVVNRVCLSEFLLAFLYFMKQHLQEEVMRYKEILGKMKDFDENLSKQKIVNAGVEKEKRRLEVS